MPEETCEKIDTCEKIFRIISNQAGWDTHADIYVLLKAIASVDGGLESLVNTACESLVKDTTLKYKDKQ